MRGLAEVTTIPNLPGQPSRVSQSSIIGQITIVATPAGYLVSPTVYGLTHNTIPMGDLGQAIAYAASVAKANGAQIGNLRAHGSHGIVYDLTPSGQTKGIGDAPPTGIPQTGAYGPGGGYGATGGAYNPAKSPVTLPGATYGQYTSWGTPGGPGNPQSAYLKQGILPDSQLPPALQRNSPYTGQQYIAIPNNHDSALLQEAALWSWIASHGGLKSCCRIPEMGAPIWDQPPWQVMPSQGIPFTESYALPTSAISGGGPYNGKDTIMGQFRVPIGWDGVINRFIVYFQGTGYADFHGDVFWRVKVNSRFARNWGNITNTYGNFGSPFDIPGIDQMRVISGQTISVLVSIPAGSSANGQAQALVVGWFYPRR